MRPAGTAHLRALKWISMLLVAAMLSGLMSSALAAASAGGGDAPLCHSMAGGGDDDARGGDAIDEFRCPYAHAVLGGAAPFRVGDRSSEPPMPMAASGTSRSERPPLPPPRA